MSEMLTPEDRDQFGYGLGEIDASSHFDEGAEGENAAAELGELDVESDPSPPIYTLRVVVESEFEADSVSRLVMNALNRFPSMKVHIVEIQKGVQP